MIFGHDRDELRKLYATAWQKRCCSEPMSPLETQISQVISEHPEYHEAVNDDLQHDFDVAGGETNPFLHMGLHLAVREQVACNRPGGITQVFKRLADDGQDAHAAEHRMIDCLAETLWAAQQQHQAPDERKYLQRLQRLCSG